MKRVLICGFLVGLAAMACADGASPPPALPPTAEAWPRQDTRALRQLQTDAFGKTTLSSDASAEESVVALGELSAAATEGEASNSFNPGDYDALYALLERYRDELLKMGMDEADLDAQIKTLRLRADELKKRLDALHPLDGLKIHGRLYSFYDDMDIVGNQALIGSSAIPSKPAGAGLEFPMGAVNVAMDLDLTQGPLSAMARFGMVQPWGLTILAPVYPQRIYVELRMPVTVQFGDIDAALTPLTLWRNDQSMPYEPEPFADRRQRLEDDLYLKPNEWPLTGARLSTELYFFGRQPLDLENIATIAGAGEALATAANQNTLYTLEDGDTLGMQYTTYMDGWKVSLPIADVVTVSEQGLLFWDVTSTQPDGDMRPLDEMTQSGRVELNVGILRGDVEYAMSSYTPPIPTAEAEEAPLTGTAAIYSLGVEGSQGNFKVYGRMVTSGFHASGAQGRTQDAGYEFLGLFPTENSQLGANLQPGLNPSYIPESYATRFNDVLIPPGVQVNHLGTVTPGGMWQNLLAYSYLENIDPYGEATPNREGFGAEGEWKIFNGIFTPRASYDDFQEIDSVEDVNSGGITDPFTMTSLSAGFTLDLNPWFHWPLRFKGGYTYDDSVNGSVDTAGYKYGLASTLVQGGVEWAIAKNMGLNFGYEHLDATGFNEMFNLGYAGGQTWDVLGYGGWWKISDDMRLDLVYSQYFESVPDVPSTDMEVDEALIRVTMSY